MTLHKRLEKFSVQPLVKTEHMPDNQRIYLSCNVDEFKVWAKTIGISAEKVVRYFLPSGSAEEQGYKSCVSLTKLEKRYDKRKLEDACEHMLAFSSTTSVRTMVTLLKNYMTSANDSSKPDSSNKYGITRGEPIEKGGDGK